MLRLRGLVVGIFLAGMLLLRSALATEGDVALKRESKEQGTPQAVFPHWRHRIRYSCYACHPAPFEMKAGTASITMDDIMAGKYCGTCHNGKIAWAVSFESCNRCHAAKQ